MSPFDRIVGGIAWLLAWIGLGDSLKLNNEILRFKENANIGYKIMISERLTSVINDQFGFTLEPHQIQGLDYPRLLPIIRVFTLRVKDIRSLYGDSYREYAQFLFDKQFRAPTVCDAGGDAAGENHPHTVSSPDAVVDVVVDESKDGDGDLDELSKELVTVGKSLEQYASYVDELQKTRQDLSLRVSDLLKKHSLSDIERDQDSERQIEELIDLRDSTLREADQFQRDCKAKIKDIKSKIKYYQSTSNDTSSSTAAVVPHVDEAKRDFEALIRLEVETKRLRRQLDAIPGSLELHQYQKRFVQLYQQVPSGPPNSEGYTTYNTNENIREQLLKEVSLLKSVYDNIVRARSKENQEKLLGSLTQWLNKANENLLRIDAKHEQAKSKRDMLSERFLKLGQIQSKYYQAVKKLQDLATDKSSADATETQ